MESTGDRDTLLVHVTTICTYIHILGAQSITCSVSDSIKGSLVSVSLSAVCTNFARFPWPLPPATANLSSYTVNGYNNNILKYNRDILSKYKTFVCDIIDNELTEFILVHVMATSKTWV